MKRKNLFWLIMGLVLGLTSMNFAAAESNSCNLEVTLLSQDPYPAMPGSYVDLVFQVTGVQNPQCEGVNFELVPTFPFSLDEGEYERSLEGDTWNENNNNYWLINYKLRVDEDALDGISEIGIKYAPKYLSDSSEYTQTFDVEVEDARTTFDAVIQETSGSEVSIAIANSGKNTANSMIVKIPEQEYFSASGTDGQMVGNLESGDYTIVSFSLNQISKDDDTLRFEIYYTDSIGERRIVNMELPVELTSTSMFDSTTSTQTSSGMQWYILAIVVVVLGAGFLIFKEYKKEKKKPSKETPEWAKSEKEKK